MTEHTLDWALERGIDQYSDPQGVDLVERCVPLEEWVDEASALGLFQYLRHHETVPDVDGAVVAWGGQHYRGINLASQDYLGLARDTTIAEAAASATLRHGTHSAGSEPMGGGFGEARALESELAEFVEHRHVVLFPTGWGAGYGAIKGLLRPYDHVLIDTLAHDCLRHGARASGAEMSFFAHNDLASLEKRLKKVRLAHPAQAILVVTESLFSMDADHPDFGVLIDICRTFDAFVMIDVAHDLGVLGPGGKGVLAEAGRLQDADLLIGSFSKAFATIGGFVASRSRAVSYYVRAYSGTYTFSNFLSPAQVAIAREALRIIRSPRGAELRDTACRRAALLRDELQALALPVIGRLSSLVLVPIGAERVARLAYRRCLERGVILNCVEFPACRRGEARFRLQVSPRHTPQQLKAAAAIIAEALAWARQRPAPHVDEVGV
jgi:7-keto-8-aminopelargonate synthetase-like enzyme